jgi:hypothetical protein
MNKIKPVTVTKAKTNTVDTPKSKKPPVEAKKSDDSTRLKTDNLEVNQSTSVSSKSSSGCGSYHSNDADDIRKEIEREEELLRLLEANYQEMLQSSKELEQCLNFINQESQFN